MAGAMMCHTCFPISCFHHNTVKFGSKLTCTRSQGDDAVLTPVQLFLVQSKTGLDHNNLFGTENVCHPISDGDRQVPALPQCQYQLKGRHSFVAEFHGAQDIAFTEFIVMLIVVEAISVSGGRRGGTSVSVSGAAAATRCGHDGALSRACP